MIQDIELQQVTKPDTAQCNENWVFYQILEYVGEDHVTRVISNTNPANLRMLNMKNHPPKNNSCLYLY